MKRNMSIVCLLALFLFSTSVSGADNEPKPGEVMTISIAGFDTKFHWCPPGDFMMGSPTSEKGRVDDETQHKVYISRGFWLAETETTQKLWQAVMGDNPSYFKGDDLPVERVSWNDCQVFIAKIQKYAPSGMKFHLPSEAQWEYACRAGTSTPFSFGSTLNGDRANCNGNYPYGTSTKGRYIRETTPVGSYDANAWGLYDMHGNVCEWCSDWYGDYPNGTVTDPRGAEASWNRVSRGGSWNKSPWICRSASRYGGWPGIRLDNLGFRLEIGASSGGR